jgi:hypothetical protein
MAHNHISGARKVTLASILSDAESGHDLLPERRAWFCDLLRNAINNARDRNRLWRSYGSSPTYPHDMVADFIKQDGATIARCERAIALLESSGA